MIKYHTWAEKLSLPILFSKAIYHNLTGADNFHRVNYGKHNQQYLLYFKPEDKLADCLLFFIHGGGWRMGNPKLFKFVGNFFAQHGFPTILPGYRLAPEFNFPAQVNDVFAGFKQGQKVAAQFNQDSNHIFIVGQSAGAHLGALLAFNHLKQKEYQINRTDLSGFISISGPLDLSVCQTKEGRRLLAKFLTSPEDEAEANPINYISGKEELPVLCLHGDQDPLVEPKNSQVFVKKLNHQRRKNGELKMIRDERHSKLVELFLIIKNTRSLNY